MKKNIHILFFLITIICFSLAQNQEMYRIEQWQDEFFSSIRKISDSRGSNKEVYIKKFLNDVQDYLTGGELTVEEEIYLTVWEIKALFYNGEIESSIIKRDQLELKVESREYNAIYGLPYFSYIDNFPVYALQKNNVTLRYS